MIRSFDYAVHTALAGHTSPTLRPEDKPALEQWGRFWYTWVSAQFLHSYLAGIQGTGLVPSDPSDLRTLLDAYLLDKAAYEVSYELNNRPEWVHVPLRGMLRLLGARE